jgi:EAL domain-containing protein (putative c-di-GMP-specific phosphodiesterase class I)
MTHQTPAEDSSTLLAPLARGLMRRIPDVVSLSIHDSKGHSAWSSADFLLAEDHALIAEVVEEASGGTRHDVRGSGCGLWWENADPARARCAVPLLEGTVFRGVALAVFARATAGEAERAARVAELRPLLSSLARALPADADLDAIVVESSSESLQRAQLVELRFEEPLPVDGPSCDIEARGREERLMTLIDAALREDEFALHLQPIVALRDDHSPADSPLIVEVLIRLPTQEFGVLASHDFLDTAERNGRMPAIDRWVIRALLVWMQRNRDRWAGARAVFCVNLSGKSVVRPDFREYLESCLDKSGVPLSALRFEISELDASLAPQEFTALARALIERGCEVSVDNVGTGTGRFDFLREVNADLLKIDGSLVAGADDDIVSRALINGLVHMADTLGMQTVASRVDTTRKLRAVKQLGVGYAQGYRLRRPEHIDSFEFVGCGAQRMEVEEAAAS